jgi:hypothetical protein
MSMEACSIASHNWLQILSEQFAGGTFDEVKHEVQRFTTFFLAIVPRERLLLRQYDIKTTFMHRKMAHELALNCRLS